MGGADEKCEDLSYETGDIDGNIRRLCQKVSIVDGKVDGKSNKI